VGFFKKSGQIDNGRAKGHYKNSGFSVLGMRFSWGSYWKIEDMSKRPKPRPRRYTAPRKASKPRPQRRTRNGR
jgi:hypothetical protein